LGNSKAYWIKRQEDRLKWLSGVEDDVLKRQKKLYKQSLQEIESKMQGLYQDLYQQSILQTDLRYIDLYQFKHYEALRNQIKGSFKGIATSQVDSLTQMIDFIFWNEIKDITGELSKPIVFDRMFSLQVEQVLNTNWSGKLFSSRVWENTSKIASKIESDIRLMITTGKSPDKIKQGIIDNMGVSFNDADRLVRTESIHFYNQATKTGYQKAGVQKYEYLASEDERLCEVCGAMHEKQFLMSQAIEGSVFPVMHPRCRCTTVPIIQL